MNRARAILATALFAAGLLPPVVAGVVHKWVDADGRTHYSDKPPATIPPTLTVIELPQVATRPGDRSEHYYSIRNQWQRINAERLARVRAKLELAREKAARRPAEPQVIYLRERGKRSYGLILPGYGKHRYRPHRHLRPTRHFAGHRIVQPWREYPAPRHKRGFKIKLKY